MKHRDPDALSQERDPLTRAVIGAAIEVHRHLGPGLLESAYEEALCLELQLSGLRYKRQVSLPLTYKGRQVHCDYRIDIIVDDKLILELKTTEKLLPVHEAQLLTYLKLSGINKG
ncbi:GxxExxY protein, partial [candidate division WOR-3 bacterium]|nr:GxxExxY protein [candidate division WOR-3 bacterium]MBD3364600.1 GxxExxY protein [candidate division WOR-3 bacterium]